ncbi:MAG: DUF452 family protein [Duncaniella sp.]|nr:DUF452 family protein [Duncaniella sp.]
MKHHFTSRLNNPRLIIVFLGWAMDYRPFEALCADGYDVMVVWDYRTVDLEAELTDGYEEIVIVAWSFGVPAAALFIAGNPSLPVTSRIAVNGTQHPVDNTRGIPEEIFTATLENLSADSLPRFYRRVAGSGASYRSFMNCKPQRDIEELREELAIIASRKPAVIDWDTAYAGRNDLIIPPDNQLAAWHDEASRIIEVPTSHLPDFSLIISDVVTDKALVAERFGKAMESYDNNAQVQHEVVRRLVEMWNPAADMHPDVIEIGCGTGFSTRSYLERITPASLELWDMVISPSLPESAVKVECDAEARLFHTPGCSADIIFTSSTVQWFNSLPAFFRNVSGILRPGGLLVMSTYGPDNFRELHAVLGTESGYPSKEDIAAMLPPSLKVEAMSDGKIVMTFNDTAEMLRHIRSTGVNALSRTVSAASTRSLMRDYPRNAAGKVELTYDPIYFIIKKI